jgi:hypothetical protein
VKWRPEAGGRLHVTENATETDLTADTFAAIYQRLDSIDAALNAIRDELRQLHPTQPNQQKGTTTMTTTIYLQCDCRECRGRGRRVEYSKYRSLYRLNTPQVKQAIHQLVTEELDPTQQQEGKTNMTEDTRTTALACPWPGCGGTVYDILVHLPHARHHRLHDGKWNWWIDDASDDVRVGYIVVCEDLDGEGTFHYYTEEDVPDQITAITDAAYNEQYGEEAPPMKAL